MTFNLFYFNPLLIQNGYIFVSEFTNIDDCHLRAKSDNHSFYRIEKTDEATTQIIFESEWLNL